MKILLATAADIAEARGDSVHIQKLFYYLQRWTEVSLLHRGQIRLVSGSIEPGTELITIRNLFKTGTYHAIFAIWTLVRGNHETVIYCRDWSVALVAGLLSFFRHFRVVYEANSLVDVEARMTPAKRLKGLLALLQLAAFAVADEIVAVTPRLASSIGAISGARLLSITVVQNAGDSEFEPVPKGMARRELGLSGDSSIVGFVGSLAPWQGLRLLVKAFRVIAEQVPEAELVIVGDGPELAPLQLEIRDLPYRSKVRFQGRVAHPVALKYICSFDVAVVPYESSLLFETVGRSPIKAYEYMACGRPLVVGAFPGLAEEVTEARCGIVVPPDDIGSLASAVVRLLRNPEQRTQMGEAGRSYVATKKSWSEVARRIFELCRSVAPGG